MKKKVSFFVHDLSANPIVRALPIAEAVMDMGYEVEILGLLLKGTEVYLPYRGRYPYLTVQSSEKAGDVRKASHALANMATGNIVYACKPLLASFYPALLYSENGNKRPLVLDVEDDDVFYQIPRSFSSLLKFFRYGWRSCYDIKQNLLLHNRIRHCSGITVSTTSLQKRYGGQILLHGPAKRAQPVPPQSEGQRILRQKLRLPQDKTLLLFAGKINAHKKFDLLTNLNAETLKKLRMTLVLAGNPNQEEFKRLQKALGNQCIRVGLIPHTDMPDLVQACDVVPVLQTPGVYSESQMPGKLLEAYAHGRPVIATNVGDLPTVVGDKTSTPRGWILGSYSSSQLLHILEDISRNPNYLVSRGSAARHYYEREASADATRRILTSFPCFEDTTEC